MLYIYGLLRYPCKAVVMAKGERMAGEGVPVRRTENTHSDRSVFSLWPAALHVEQWSHLLWPRLTGRFVRLCPGQRVSI